MNFFQTKVHLGAHLFVRMAVLPGEEYEGEDQEDGAHIHLASHLMFTHTALEMSMKVETMSMELTFTMLLISWLHVLIQHRRGV
jgi:hypothetical protein